MRYLILLLTLFFIFGVSEGQSALGPAMYDHNLPQIVYSGAGITWTTVSDSTNYGGSRYSSGQVTSTTPRIEFSIWGSGFTLYIYRNTIGADATLCVDGVCSGISYYNPTNQNATVTVSGLAYGTHTVSIQKSTSTNAQMNLDGVYVAPPGLPPTVIPPTPIVVVTVIVPTQEPTPTGTQFVYVGNFPEETEEASTESIIVAGQESLIRYEIRPTDIVIVIMLGMLVIIGGTGLVVRLWGDK